MKIRAIGRFWLPVVCAIIFLLLSPVARQASPPAPSAEPTYDVYALSYGTLADYPLANLVAGADKSKRTDLEMMIWLLEGSQGKHVLVDTGFYREKLFQHWKILNFIRPTDAVAKLGLKPDQITDIILTHVHWDHVGGLELFPKAQVWIQKDEFNYYCATDTLVPGIDPDDKAVLIKLKTAGRLHLVNGDDKKILPGIRVYTGGKHTYATQYVGVHTRQGTTIVASDNIYLYENLEKHVPIGATLDANSNVKAQDRMKTLVRDPKFIIPGHDPAVFVRFPKPGNGVAKIE